MKWPSYSFFILAKGIRAKSSDSIGLSRAESASQLNGIGPNSDIEIVGKYSPELVLSDGVGGKAVTRGEPRVDVRGDRFGPV